MGKKEKRRACEGDHERDIVQYGPESSFVDKWIFMLINWDTDMSEHCGECGIILTPRPYTRTTVIPSVCVVFHCPVAIFCIYFLSGVTFNLEQCALLMPQMGIGHAAELDPSGKMSHAELSIPHFHFRDVPFVHIVGVQLHRSGKAKLDSTVVDNEAELSRC